jgi:hypothetical protein
MAGHAGLSDMPHIPFDSLMAMHRGARRRNQLLFWGLLAAGLMILGLGLFGVLPQVAAIMVGLVAAAVAVFPHCEMVERDERIEGLLVLQDEWRQMVSTSRTPEQDADRFVDLLWRLYEKL